MSDETQSTEHRSPATESVAIANLRTRSAARREKRIGMLTVLASFALLLVAWTLVSVLVGSIVLPTPLQTIGGIITYHESGNLWSDLGITLGRVLAALVVSFFFSLIAGMALSRLKWVDQLFGTWVAIFSAIPALLILLVVYLAVGLNDAAAVVGTSLVVVPSMTYGVWNGMNSLQPELSEMAQVFGVPASTIVRRVILPQTWPFLFANIRQGLSLTWKIMVFAEILGLSSGVGYRMQYWFQMFNMEQVLSTAIPFMIAMMALEYFVLRPAERHLFKWKVVREK